MIVKRVLSGLQESEAKLGLHAPSARVRLRDREASLAPPLEGISPSSESLTTIQVNRELDLK